jgi:hypothetical protein
MRGIRDEDLEVDLESDLHVPRGSEGYGPTIRGDAVPGEPSPEENRKLFFQWDKDPRSVRRTVQRLPHMKVVVLEFQDKQTGEWRLNLAEASRDATEGEISVVKHRLRAMGFKISEKHSFRGVDMGKGGFGPRPGPPRGKLKPPSPKSPSRGYSLPGVMGALAVVSGLLTSWDYLEFPEQIDGIKASGVDPAIVNRALERHRHGVFAGGSGGLHKVHVSEPGMPQHTNILIHDKTGYLFAVVLESTSEAQLGDIVPYGKAVPVGKDVIHQSHIFKDYERGDVYYRSPENGRWMLNGASTGHPDFLKHW